MIEFVGAGKRFVSGPRPWRGPVTIDALKDVTLSIPEGGAWGVVGPNGAGKSTLFALLLGFLQPTSGAVRIRGLAPRRYVRRHGAAYLPERFRVPGEWRVRPALVALARLEGLRPDVAARRADEALQRLGLEPFADREVRTLSRGVLQRLGLAQALLGERELLVLDEPTEGLDPLWRIKLRAILEEQRAAGRTILLASHDLAEVERVVERVVLLDGGRVREVFETALAGGKGATRGPLRYRLELAGAARELEEAFPGAVPVGPGEPGAYRVTVADEAELSTRLGALIAAGGVVSAVLPETEPLEARVQRALGSGGEAT